MRGRSRPIHASRVRESSNLFVRLHSGGRFVLRFSSLSVLRLSDCSFAVLPGKPTPVYDEHMTVNVGRVGTGEENCRPNNVFGETPSRGGGSSPYLLFAVGVSP